MHILIYTVQISHLRYVTAKMMEKLIKPEKIFFKSITLNATLIPALQIAKVRPEKRSKPSGQHSSSNIRLSTQGLTRQYKSIITGTVIYYLMVRCRTVNDVVFYTQSKELPLYCIAVFKATDERSNTM